MLNTIATRPWDNAYQKESDYIHDESPRWEIAPLNSGEHRNTPLEGLRNIQISQRRSSSRIIIIVQFIKLIIDTIIYGYTLHFIYGCSIHLVATIWSSVIHLFHLGKSIKTGKENEEDLQPETLPTTKEPRSTSFLSPKHHHSAYNISTVDEKKSYRELRKFLNSN